MNRCGELQREIRRLETQLDPTSSEATIDELARVRQGLTDAKREPAIELPNLRIGFACKQRWDDMVGDDRVRACAGCNRPVFNLSAMTRAEAERVLATHGLTPCVRFYRRPDGTVMTTDCPVGTRREGRRLAVIASSLAAGTALASPSASAEPALEPTVAAPADSTADAPPPDPTATQTQSTEPVVLDATIEMGIPVSDGYEMGVILGEPERPKLEWSIWGRLGTGVAKQHATVIARSLTPPEHVSTSVWEAAIAADVTVGIARDGNIRLGAWGELRTSTGPVAGSELVVEDLPPHPFTSRIGGAGSVVLRAGGNAHVITTALGIGYVGSWPRIDPWIRWARHLVGARVVASMNHSLDDPRDWSATLGLEVEPLGAVHAVLDLVTGR